jgi:hypothetical protein
MTKFVALGLVLLMVVYLGNKYISGPTDSVNSVISNLLAETNERINDLTD